MAVQIKTFLTACIILFASYNYSNPKILIVSFGKVGGHASLVDGLKKYLAKRSSVEVLDCEDFSRCKGANYYKLLQSSIWLVSLMQMFHHRFHAIIDIMPEFISNLFYKVQEFRKHIESNKYDLVIFTSPIHWNIINKICMENKLPCVNIINDYGQPEYADSFWIREREMVYLVPESHYFTQLFGYESVINLSGIPIREKFKKVRKYNKKYIKQKLGLNKTKTCVLVFFGAAGSDDMLPIAEGASLSEAMQYVFICASNDSVREKINKLNRDNFVVLGYVDDPSEYVRAADIMIGKPGATSVTESIQSETPCVFRLNGPLSVTPIEMLTLKFVLEKKYGEVVPCYNSLQYVIPRLASNSIKFPHNNGLEESVHIINRFLRQIHKLRNRLYD